MTYRRPTSVEDTVHELFSTIDPYDRDATMRVAAVREEDE